MEGAVSEALVKAPHRSGRGRNRPGAPKPDAARDIMQLDTWYDLAVRELGELTDHAKEMLDEAEQAETGETAETAEKVETASRAPMADEDELPAVPPAAAA